MVAKPSLEVLRTYPHMAHWFSPILLAKLLLRVIVADVFGQYADRRLIEAALDTVPEKDLATRADISGVLVPDNDGAVWIDFVADLGDGFDATYAIASLLSQDFLEIDGLRLPRGGSVVMGGDEVYPTATRDDYRQKTLYPYWFAFPDRRTPTHPLILAIPGNHDWYDGLATFLAFFARQKATRFGHWRTRQRRSYFAAKLSELCWLWAIDVALVEDMDQPQADYFVSMAKQMSQGANIILCSAEPGWYKAEENSESYRTLSYAAWIAENAGKALRIPLILSGDTHHYSRYSSGQGVQYITSGGGGAFLHGTHQLPDEIRANWLRDESSVLLLKTTPDNDHSESEKSACWPDKEESRRLLKGDLIFSFLNFDFALLLGTIYWLFAFILSSLPRHDVGVLIFLTLFSGFAGYAGYQENWKRRALAAAFVESLAHFGSIFLLCRLALYLDTLALNQGPWWIWLAALGLFIVPIGGFVGGQIFGFKLWLTCRFFDMNHNDAFSAMRLFDYRHFLRIRVLGDQITVFAIGLRRVPRRNEWRDNPACSTDPTAPYFIPVEPMQPQLIERPIVVSGHRASPTTDIKKPGELQ